jgi:hypothetical protein
MPKYAVKFKNNLNYADDKLQWTKQLIWPLSYSGPIRKCDSWWVLSYSGPILVLLLPWRPTGNVTHDEWCTILVLFWSYSGPIAAMTAHWKCDAWWVMSYSGPRQESITTQSEDLSQQSPDSRFNYFWPNPQLSQQSTALRVNLWLTQSEDLSQHDQSKAFSTINNFKSQSITSQISTASGINDFRT